MLPSDTQCQPPRQQVKSIFSRKGHSQLYTFLSSFRNICTQMVQLTNFVMHFNSRENCFSLRWGSGERDGRFMSARSKTSFKTHKKIATFKILLVAHSIHPFYGILRPQITDFCYDFKLELVGFQQLSDLQYSNSSIFCEHAQWSPYSQILATAT